MYNNGILAEVCINRRVCTEYGLKDCPGSVSSCYIEAKNEQEYYFRVDLRNYPDGKFVIGIWVDGSAVYYESVHKSNRYHWYSIGPMFEKSREGDMSAFVQMKMLFVPLQDDRLSHPLEETTNSHFGVKAGSLDSQKGKIIIQIAMEIESEMFIGNMFPFVFHQLTAPEALDASDNETIDEDSNGLGPTESSPGPTHKVVFTAMEIENLKSIEIPPEHRAGQMSGPILGTFIFNYLSADMLDDMDLLDADEYVGGTMEEELYDACKTLLLQKRALRRRNRELLQENKGNRNKNVSIQTKVMDLTQD